MAVTLSAREHVQMFRATFNKCVSSFASWFCLLVILGCDSGLQTAPVSGRILLDGKPFADARIHFQPTASPGNDLAEPLIDSYGTTDAEGRFALRLSDSDAEG